jgi:predicted dehydrogenase
MSDELSRRALLGRAGRLAAAGTFLGAAGAKAANTDGPQAQAGVARPAAAERIGLGFVGVGGMGKGLLQDFISNPDVDVVAIADVYDKHGQEAVQIAAAKGHKPDLYRDFRRVLDRREIDAVVIATPDHWHALTAIHACHAGKDVYVEKPLSYSIAEGRAMINTARRFNRVTQMGTQIHAGENYRRVVEIVRSGVLGEISKVRVWLAGNWAPEGFGSPADCPPPPDCDYDMWLGPAPTRPFNPLRFTRTFRFFWDYAGGKLSDFACHLTDLVYWALELDAPRTVTASGGRYTLHDICETPDTMEVVWEYASSGPGKTPFQLVWSHTEGNARGFEGGRGLGIAFYGSEGTLIADYEGHELFNRKNEPIKDRPERTIPPSPGHRREFLDCVKSRKRCSCDIEYGYKLTILPLMGNIALRTGLKLNWDNQNERFIDAPAANRLLTREYRSPWTLPA